MTLIDTIIRTRIGGHSVHRTSLILLTLLLCRLSVAAPADPCGVPDPDGQPFSFRLHRSYLGEGGFFGEFDIENRSAKAIAIPGHRKEGSFSGGRPDISIQFQDLTESWQPMLALPGSFFARPDLLTIPPGGKSRLTVYLMSEDTANKGAGAFRVLIRLLDPPTCITSASFAPMPQRPRVTGFESSQDLSSRK